MAQSRAIAGARLSADIPWLQREERLARGTYLVLRGKYQQALGLLDVDEEPLVRTGWKRARATLARAHNGLGNHAQARDIGLNALAHSTPHDAMYVVANLSLQVQFALAEARAPAGCLTPVSCEPSRSRWSTRKTRWLAG